MTVTLKEIKDAKALIHPYIVNTPLIHLHQLDEILGCSVYAKLENMQNTHAFKIRGAMNKILRLTDTEKEHGIVASSSGNHGQAVAYAAKHLGIQATIVIPKTATDFKIKAIEQHGAEIVYCDVEERFTVTNELAQKYHYTIIPPFDDSNIVAGQGTIGLEIIDGDFDAVIVPTSGGGLIGGIATALKESGFNGKVIGAEPERLPRYSTSLNQEKRTKIPTASTIADALVVNEPGEINFPIVQKYVDSMVTVSDEAMKRAQKLMLMEGKILAEISSCIGIGAILEGKLEVTPEEKICFIVSGGNLGFDQLKILED
jgi:threonine dehydratase